MDCDALKKALLKDLDSTFLGHVGAVIPESEFEWDTNPARGLGDYRIPKEMVTELDGTRIPYDDIAPNKGTVLHKSHPLEGMHTDGCCYSYSYFIFY